MDRMPAAAERPGAGSSEGYGRAIMERARPSSPRVHPRREPTTRRQIRAQEATVMIQADARFTGPPRHPRRRGRSRFHEFDRVYFDYLASEYRGLPPEGGDAEARRIVEEVLH